MTDNFEYLMELFACGAKGIPANMRVGFTDWDAVLQLANEQSIYYTVIYGIKRMPDCSLARGMQVTLFAELKTVAIAAFSGRLRILKLLEDFDDAGIRVILLKGYSVASLYDSPDTRLSGDVDIYVEREDEKRAQDFLRQQGFEVFPRDRRAHHAICCHPELGHLELHVSFYGNSMEKIWFHQIGKCKLIEEACEKVVTLDGTYYSLGKTDNLIFLALHMIKHFILGGMSLRVIMDFSLFYVTNEDTINLNRFWQIAEQLNYEYFLKIILCISNKYFDIPIKNVPDCEDVKERDILDVLNDLETGGWLGINNSALRSEGGPLFNGLKLINNKGNIGFILYTIGQKIVMIISSMFPSRKHMATRFPYVQYNIILVPVAWFNRLFTRGFSYLIQGKLISHNVRNETQLNDVAKERVALFRQIKII